MAGTLAPRRERHTGAVPDLWRAPVARTPIEATVALPGSKSMTNRALVLAALGTVPTVVRRALVARDTELMADGLAVLGGTVDRAGPDWRIDPGPLRAGGTVQVGNAGTVLRFLPVLAALADGPVRFEGDARAGQRPLAPLLVALRSLGVEVDDGGRGGLPLVVHGRGGLPGGTVDVDASRSSQFVSALLLAAARAAAPLTVRHVGPPMPSAPHVAMTVAMLRTAGIDIRIDGPCWTVHPAPISAAEWLVEPDLSNAAPFLAAALVTGGTVRIPGWPTATTQAGAALPALLTRMGARVSVDVDGLLLSGTGRVEGLDVDLHDVGELAPVLAAVCALADSPSRLRGIAHLREHETDRLAALGAELGGLGGVVEQTADGLRITPATLHGGTFRTYADHRLATAAAVLGLVVDGVLVEDIATTGKTMPGFPRLWTAMLAGTEH